MTMYVKSEARVGTQYVRGCTTPSVAATIFVMEARATVIDDINTVLESSSHRNMRTFTRSLTLYGKLRSGENLLQSYCNNGIRTYRLAQVDTRTSTNCQISKSKNIWLSKRLKLWCVGECCTA